MADRGEDVSVKHRPGMRALGLHGSYGLWLCAAIGSELGSTVMAFAVIWMATGFGGATAGLVATSTLLFRAVLLLVGGAAGDRFGPRRVMIACDASMLVVTCLIALWFGLRGVSVGALLVVGGVLGIVSAFYMPASGVFPRLFFDDAHLARVMATTSSGLQLARIAGPAAAGALLASIGLSWLIALNAASFLLVLVVVVMVVPPRSARPSGGSHVGLRVGLHAIRTTAQHRVLISLLIAFAVLVAGTSPAVTLLFPLLCRHRGWAVSSAGLLEAAFMAAALGVGAIVAARGTFHRSGLALVGGPTLAGAGLLVAADAPAVWVACAASSAVGAGLVTFNTHAVPRFLAASPPGTQVRLQSVLGLAATVPVLALSSLYGLIAQHASPSWALGIATICALAAAAVMTVAHPWTTPRSAIHNDTSTAA